MFPKLVANTMLGQIVASQLDLAIRAAPSPSTAGDVGQHVRCYPATYRSSNSSASSQIETLRFAMVEVLW
jgi:hypothetical protein